MSRRLRVVHIVEQMTTGGMERVVETLAKTTDSARFDVSVLCLKEKGAVAEHLASVGIEVHLAGVPRHPPEYLAFRRVARCLRELSPDVVHTHNTPGLVYGAVGAWLAGVRTIVHTEHGRQFPDRLRYMVAERIASAVTWRVVGVSDDMTAALRQYVRIPRRKLRTIQNGVIAIAAPQPAEQRAVLESIGVAPDTPTVGVAARLVWEKGIEFLLDAWPTVVASFPSAVLILLGDGPEREALEAQAQRLGIQDRVRFAGMRSDVSTFVHAFDVCVMPSVSEGLPMALLEAMAAGRPIVATKIGGMPQALADGHAGLLIPSGDPNALAAAILDLLSSPEKARALGSAARARFEDRYTAQAMTAAYETMYLRHDDSAWTPNR